MLISIFIPTKNAGPKFKLVLENIFKQPDHDIEVIMVDSGSTDETIAIGQQFPIKIYQIRPSDFGHGKTRNLALNYAHGSLIIFLTQDAVPANQSWLKNLVKHFNQEKIAGVFSRQIPNTNDRETEIFFYQHHFPEQKIIRPKIKNKNFFDQIFFSNVSCCIRKDILEKYPFDETLIMSEDQQWSKDVLAAGYQTIYEPESIVVHSHDYNFKQTVQRYFDSAFSLQIVTNGKFKNFTHLGAGYMIRELFYVTKKNPAGLPHLIANNLAKIIGTTTGLHQKVIPYQIKKRLSLHQYFWRK